MVTKKLAIAVYLLFAAISILYGAVSLIAPSVLHSESSRSFPLAHNLRELGAAGIFLGLMALWCSFNYERSRTVHYLLTVFTLLLAAIHWHDYLIGHLPVISPLYNTMPFLVFGSLALARRGST